MLIFVTCGLFFNFSFSMDLLETEIDWLTKEKFEAVKKDYQESIKIKLEELNKQDMDEKLKEYTFECYKIDYAVELLQNYESSTQGINLAYFYGYKQYDKLLNKYYSYKNKLDKKTQTALLEEQRAWLKLRDAYENYIDQHRYFVYTASGGGTMYSNLASASKFDFVKKRVGEIYKYFFSENGVDW
ncbi:putative protein (DUF1311 domain) [Campylobacter sp. RM16704]|nr:putative protein (DUF1311 domain) [Campylobacter sp. RM16704]